MRRRTVLFTGLLIAGSAFSNRSIVSAATYDLIPQAPGPYAPAAGQPGSTAIRYDSPSFTEWASGYSNLTRGPQDIANPTGELASYGSPTDALGPAQNSTTSHVVSLGDGGSMTLTFDQPIANGNGPDFAVFENAFNDNFLELAFVEVSSDGTNFFRFPSVSLTSSSTQEGPFDGDLDPTNLYDLAGKYRVGFGTPFDLAELTGVAGLDVNDVRYVRVVDVVGRVTPVLDANNSVVWSPSLDHLGNIVNDPYPTPFSSGGFDLDGVGVINETPEPASSALLACASVLLAGRRMGRAASNKSFRSVKGE